MTTNSDSQIEELRLRARKLFDRLSNPDTMVYRIAHAKRPNSANNYDGGEFVNTFEKMIDRQLDVYDEAIELVKPSKSDKD